jgi:hypothetical protein
LSDADLSGRTRKISFVGNGHEIAQLMNFHREERMKEELGGLERLFRAF